MGRAEYPDADEQPRQPVQERLVGPPAGQAPEVAPDLASDVGTTFPRDAAEGPSDATEGNEPYFPPTDPVVTPRPGSAQQLEVLGGFTPTSTDDVGLEHESQLEGRSQLGPMPGDDEVKAAVVRELREDAMTTDLALRVDVRDGVVTLRGLVPTLEDSEAALEVAGRVEGVAHVVDEIEVEGLTDR